MANHLKRSRTIPLESKEAKNLLSQSGLSIIDINQGTGLSKSGEIAEEPLSQRDHQFDNESDFLSKRSQREGDLYCQACRVSLGGREEQLVHYRLDWHRYNLKRRLKGLAPLSQEEFERIAGGDLSSISGSESDSDSNKENEEETKVKPSQAAVKEESDDDDDRTRSKTVGSPFLYFSTGNGRCFGLYRNIVTNLKVAEVQTSMTSDLLNSLTSLAQPQVWIILMRAGGHFAGAVFRGSTMLAHKTFHRYTVRAKRGTAQSVRDAHQGGHAPRSAGASLRRYNEAALVTEIRELISSWSSHVEEASVIFIRTPKYGKGVFIGDGSSSSSGSGGNAPFSRSDPRLRNIPFATRRPTVKEVQSVHSKLSSIYEVNSDQFNHAATRSKSPKMKPKKSVKELEREKHSVVVNVPPDEVEISNLVDLPDNDISDEVEGENDATTDGIAKKTSAAKRKKRRRAKKPSEPQDDMPAAVQKLMKFCRLESGEDSDAVVAELLCEMGIQSLFTYKESKCLSNKVRCLEESATAAVADDSRREGEKETEEDKIVSATSSNDEPVNLLNGVWNGETVLHVAAASGNSSLIPILLLHGANPTIKNGAGHTAYVVAKDKNVRDAFRRFMAQHPTSYDYTAAKVPSPLTEEMERERKEKMAEKKRAQKRAKKQREKEHKSEVELEQSKKNQEKLVADLSEREKRALAAEKRMSAQLPNNSAVLKAGVCSFCESSLAGLVPFERLQYKYCSMDCLKRHRTQLT